MGFMDGLKKAGRMMVMGEVDAIRGVRDRKQVIDNGLLTSAVCRKVELKWDRDEGDPSWGASVMTLEVTPPDGGDPYEWTGEVLMKVSVAKRLDPNFVLEGQALPVKVDPEDPQRVAVDWDSVPT
jgi:hypothetical protein